MQYDSNKLLLIVDLAGTFLFEIEGATAAIRGDVDLLGVLVLAFSTALAGGIIRDLLIGDVPPASLRDWRYAAIAFAGGLVAFCLYRAVQEVPPGLIMVLDAAGLALFAVAGTEKALQHKMHPFIAVLLGIRSRASAGERFGTCFWRKSRRFCARTYTPRRLWRVRSSCSPDAKSVLLREWRR